MAKHLPYSIILVLVTILISSYHSEQLQFSQSQALLRLQGLLNFPSVLSSWNSKTDFCNSETNSFLAVVCYGDTITQLHIIGEKKAPILPKNFSIDSFVKTLVKLPNLKVLTLVSLGISGPLPGQISHLSSLEIVNVSSNFLYGSIPHELSVLSNLHTLILDENMFAGELPNWLGSLSSLTALSLKNNMLNGSLPDSLSSLANLRVLSLSHNHFFGEIPDFGHLTNLQVLELDNNAFGSRFPQLGNKLVTLVLSNNKFRSGIPDEISSYYQLERLDISSNTFVGPFQPALLSLPSMTYLNISGNEFTGMLSENLSCNSELEVVDLSSNLLTGSLPRCLVSDFKNRIVLYAKNCLEDTNQNQQPPSFCHTEAIAVGIMPEKEKHKKLTKVVILLGIVGGTLGGAALVVLIFLIIRRGSTKINMKNPSTRVISENAASGYTSKLLSNARYISQTIKMGPVGLPTYRTFSLEDIEMATKNFSTSSFMGQDSHSQMYRGQLKDGSIVAIRCVKMIKRLSTQNLMHHIELIQKLRHRHLVSALGHYFESHLDDSSVSRIFIVFEYVPNGTLRSWISDGHSRQLLSWTQRIAVAIGIANGIQFLHTGIVPGIYANNLKITDVLLDQSLTAKINSCNLPLFTNTGKVGRGNSSSGQKSAGVSKSGKFEDKSDIYDFGVILLEVILGRIIKSINDVDAFRDLLQASITAEEEARRAIADPAVRWACLDQSLKTMMEICIRCLVKDPAERPSVEDVLWNLQFAAQVQDAWRGDSQSSEGSPSGSPFEPQRRNTFH